MALALRAHVVVLDMLPILVVTKPPISFTIVTALTNTTAAFFISVLQQFTPAATVLAALSRTQPVGCRVADVLVVGAVRSKESIAAIATSAESK